MRRLLLLLISFLICSVVSGQDLYLQLNSELLPDVPSPKQVLGFEPGDRPAQHIEVVTYLKKLAEVSPRVKYVESGQTHEAKLLGYVVITSEENHKNLDAIREQMNNLADPRSGKKPDISKLPAVAWMMYSIHGDELSGTDASLMLAYQLAAGKDETTMQLINELVIGIDPMENPDGRDRYIAQLNQWKRNTPNSDIQDISHQGIWPYGRGNHYLFDLNRDWFILAHPESRARVKAILEWHPQLVVDAHEMGSYDTFLFNPPREPINQNINDNAHKWWKVFSREQAEIFDQFNWSYYTRAWYDDLYPGYGSTVSNYSGSVGILYEQASTDGSLVKKPGGKMSTFKDAVTRQFISSIANLRTAARNRESLLNDFYLTRKAASENKGAFFIVPGENPSRAERLIERLMMSGIEVSKTTSAISVNARNKNHSIKNRTIPGGSYAISLGQPMGIFTKAILEFDPRMINDVLQKELKLLEQGKGTHLYEITAWSMLLAYDVEAYFTESANLKSSQLITKVEERKGTLHNALDARVFLCEYKDDKAIDALLDMFEKDLKIRSSKEKFEANGRKYDRGTLLLRENENADNLVDVLQKIAKDNNVNIYGVQTMRLNEGPDLGGREFELLEKPNIALITGPGLSGYSVGSVWYLLDHELKIRFSFLNHDNFSRHDLRKYNVIVLPDIWGGIDVYKNILGDEGIKKLKTWVDEGGTLIGMNRSAAFLADSSSGLSQVKLKRQALNELELYKTALENDQDAFLQIDSLEIWGEKKSKKGSNKVAGANEETASKKNEQLDAKQRLFQPRGAILNVVLDQEHWLNFGLGESVPAILYSNFAFMAKKPVQTTGRFDTEENLRLSGLLWPLAKERWANTAYSTREANGKGQVILFAGEPNFRSYFYGTARMLINAMILGPGMGSSVEVEF